MPMRHNVEFKDLDLLMAVTEAGSFRGAAAAMTLEASAVSRRIRALEDRLGAALFERTRSGVRLTEAGHLFHKQAGSVIEHLDNAIQAISLVGRAESGKVALGVGGSLSSHYMSQLIRRYRIAHPGVVLTLSEGSSHDQLTAIVDRSLDLAFVLGTPSPEGLDAQRLWSEPVVAALASEDTRAAQARLSFRSIAEDHFIVSCDSPGPDIHDYIIRSLSDLSFRPQVSRYKVGREALIQMVGLGVGISLVCGSEMSLSYPHVTLVPLDGEEVPFSAIWSPRNDNPALRRFLSLARTLSREKQQSAAAL